MDYSAGVYYLPLHQLLQAFHILNHVMLLTHNEKERLIPKESDVMYPDFPTDLETVITLC